MPRPPPPGGSSAAPSASRSPCPAPGRSRAAGRLRRPPRALGALQRKGTRSRSTRRVRAKRLPHRVRDVDAADVPVERHLLDERDVSHRARDAQARGHRAVEALLHFTPWGPLRSSFASARPARGHPPARIGDRLVTSSFRPRSPAPAHSTPVARSSGPRWRPSRGELHAEEVARERGAVEAEGRRQGRGAPAGWRAAVAHGRDRRREDAALHGQLARQHLDGHLGAALCIDEPEVLPRQEGQRDAHLGRLAAPPRTRD